MWGVTSLGVGAHLQAWGVPAERITELDWWEEARVPGSYGRPSRCAAQAPRGLQRGYRADVRVQRDQRQRQHLVAFGLEAGYRPAVARLEARRFHGLTKHRKQQLGVVRRGEPQQPDVTNEAAEELPTLPPGADGTSPQWPID